MIGITGYKQAEATSFSELPKLQPGGYVLKILNVKVEPTDWGSRLAIQFDIAEGEFEGFFDKLIMKPRRCFPVDSRPVRCYNQNRYNSTDIDAPAAPCRGGDSQARRCTDGWHSGSLKW